MPVFALWSAPRSRSTAFFRSMAQRGDLTVLHEPFCNLNDYGETDVGERTFDSPASLLAWLRDEVHGRGVLLQDTMDQQHNEVLGTGGFSDASNSPGFEWRERASSARSERRLSRLAVPWRE